MYAGESRSPSAIPQEPTDSGAGVEVIQLANGETIWCVDSFSLIPSLKWW